MAILICDAPCHGDKYHDYRDRHPKDDIRDAIEKMIENRIILIGFNFTEETKKMYAEIGKIFKEKDKEDLFLYADLTNVSMDKLAG